MTCRLLVLNYHSIIFLTSALLYPITFNVYYSVPGNFVPKKRSLVNFQKLTLNNLCPCSMFKHPSVVSQGWCHHWSDPKNQLYKLVTRIRL
ncbi:hypothetical protein BDC45DRAFT_492930, partial [Circinella umbellata]